MRGRTEVNSTYPWLIQPFVENGKVKYRVENLNSGKRLSQVYNSATEAQEAANKAKLSHS